MAGPSATHPGPLPPPLLPDGIRSRIVGGVGDLDMHILEAGFEGRGRPAILLLHGFPELAWCWRRVMPLLADAGYHVIAPDQRGVGRTTPQPDAYVTDLEPYATGNLAADIFNLMDVLGRSSVDTLVGHDAGSIVAGFCALSRPERVRRLVLSASPFGGAPPAGSPPAAPFLDHPVHEELARLPQPRKHYQAYYCGPDANADMQYPPQGLHMFLRGYYHQKSADWDGNRPGPLKGWTGEEIARLPDYYCMPAQSGMAEVAAAIMPDARQVAACTWLSDADLAVAAGEFARNGFQPALNWYRSALAEGMTGRDMTPFQGCRLPMPVAFVSGRADWGPYQAPGLMEAMRGGLATEPVAIHFVDGAGHWVQQEQPERFAEILLAFSRRA
ncbi:alpha/beta fold hydrolase [Novosphingobium colocasiae]|uniref:alpha/beta hydrolase n=1 Tax=Novosphingobium colocasiae TaxID=1256513 RepID=UPI0035B13C71